VVGYWHGFLTGASADLHMAQWMPLPLTVCCFSKIQIGFTFLVPVHLGSPGQRAVCVCVLCRKVIATTVSHFQNYRSAVLKTNEFLLETVYHHEN